MKKSSPSEDPMRARILAAAFQAFGEKGYAGASTLEIATRAKLSKRDVYARFPTKQDILLACIAARTQRMAPRLTAGGSRKTLEDALAQFGATVLREVSQPEVIAMFRLAIAEAERAPQVAAALTRGRAAPRGTVAQMLAEAQQDRLIGPGDPQGMTEQFFALLWGDLLLDRLLGRAKAPKVPQIQARARAACRAFLTLHPSPR